jgi:hypothetical protein
VSAAPHARAAAATPSIDLGGPDYNGYCMHLGFVRPQLSGKEWSCLHADGTTSPLDVQADCEFTYTQRPIAALQLAPGVPFTWQCYAAVPGKVVLPPGAGGGGAGASPLATAVLRALVPTGPGAKIGMLLRRGRYPTSFHAPGLGRLTLSWLYKRGPHSRAVLVASATVPFAHAATQRFGIVLTAKGRRLLRNAARLRISASGGYVANASSPIGASTSFTLRR